MNEAVSLIFPTRSALPVFPELKPLELSDKPEIDALTRKFAPYCDFNFSSLWSWDIHGRTQVSSLNGNLVIRSCCPFSGETFLSFIGEDELRDTSDQLLAHCAKEGLEPKLRFVPECSIAEGMNVSEDRDHFDYVWTVDDLVALSVSKSFRQKRRRIKKLWSASPSMNVSSLNLQSKRVKAQIADLCRTWQKSKGLSNESVESELVALARCLELSRETDFLAFGVFLDEQIIAFSIGEVVQHRFLLSHFWKTDHTYCGLGELLTHEQAKLARQLGCEFINAQEDLGIPGLRQSKMSWGGELFLKKYAICA